MALFTDEFGNDPTVKVKNPLKQWWEFWK